MSLAMFLVTIRKHLTKATMKEVYILANVLSAVRCVEEGIGKRTRLLTTL